MKQLRVIYRPEGKAGEYAHFAVNFYNGCSNDCGYCYLKRGQRSHVWSTTPTLRAYFTNPSNRRKDERDLNPEEFAIRAFALDIEQLLQTDGEELKRYGIFLSFSTDPLLPETIDLTFFAADFCLKRDVPVMILSKRTDTLFDHSIAHGVGFRYWMAAMEGVQTLPPDSYGRTASLWNLAFGFTLTGCDDEEPCANSNSERIGMMYALHELGFKTFASIEPVIDWAASYKMIGSSLSMCDHYMIGLHSGVKKDYYNAMQSMGYLYGIVQKLLPQHRNTIYFKDSVQQLVRESLSADEAQQLLSYSVGSNFSIFGTKGKVVLASDCTCCVCGKPAVAFWPNIDPDIPSRPYCRQCLDNEQVKALASLVCDGDAKAAKALHTAWQKNK